MVAGRYSHRTWLTRALSSLYKNEDLLIYNPTGLFNNIVPDYSLVEFVTTILSTFSCGSNSYNHHTCILGSCDSMICKDIISVAIDYFNSSSNLVFQDHTVPNWIIDYSDARDLGFCPVPTEHALKYLLESLYPKSR